MKIVIWGHKLGVNANTISFVFNGFYRAFKLLGYETYWLDNDDKISDFDLNNSLFLTEGQVCQGMPIRKDCKYVLHNVYDPRLNKEDYKILPIQVYNKCCLNTENKNLQKINDYTFYETGCLYQPWATDLLPDEIDLSKADIPKENNIYFIGTITTGWNDIIEESSIFAKAAKTKNIEFVHLGGCGRFISTEEGMNLTTKAYCAPILQSVKQRGIMYIPCRIFKNISYGQYPVTNCAHLQFLFPGKVIYNEDPYQLFFDFEEKKNKEILKEMMNEVKQNHTFINRIKQILEVI